MFFIQTLNILFKGMFQLNQKSRRSGMDRRNLGSMDGVVLVIHEIWIRAIHAVMT
jgi:outer membrane scaffolding protein for murein synthesis (MipA/OmpV family)